MPSGGREKPSPHLQTTIVIPPAPIDTLDAISSSATATAADDNADHAMDESLPDIDDDDAAADDAAADAPYDIDSPDSPNHSEQLFASIAAASTAVVAPKNPAFTHTLIAEDGNQYNIVGGTEGFQTIISDVMRGFGDCEQPRDDTVMLVERILVQQMRCIVKDVIDVAVQRKGRTEPTRTDFEYLMRRNPAKVVRLQQHIRDLQLKRKWEELQKNTLNAAAAAAAAAVASAHATAEPMAQAPEPPAPAPPTTADTAAPRTPDAATAAPPTPAADAEKAATPLSDPATAPAAASMPQTPEDELDTNGILSDTEDGDREVPTRYDEEKVRRIFRADRVSQQLSGAAYLRYNEARRTSFCCKNSPRLRDKLRRWLHCEFPLSNQVMTILAYLAHETIAVLVDYAILTRLDSGNRSNEPFERVVSSKTAHTMLQLCPEVTQGRGMDGIQPISPQEIQEAMRRLTQGHNRTMGPYRGITKRQAMPYLAF